jgi:hypothetical protein
MWDVTAHLVDEVLPRGRFGSGSPRCRGCSLRDNYDRRLCADMLPAFIGALRRRWARRVPPTRHTVQGGRRSRAMGRYGTPCRYHQRHEFTFIRTEELEDEAYAPRLCPIVRSWSGVKQWRVRSPAQTPISVVPTMTKKTRGDSTLS